MFSNDKGVYVTLEGMGSKVFTTFLKGVDINIKELVEKHEHLVYKNPVSGKHYYHTSLCEAIVKDDICYEPVDIVLPIVPESSKRILWSSSIIRVDDTPRYTILRVRQQYTDKKIAELKERCPDMTVVVTYHSTPCYTPCPVGKFVSKVANNIVVTDKTFTLAEGYTQDDLCIDYALTYTLA